MRAFRYPPKPAPGDRVAVLSPSAGLPALFPDVYEMGLRRLREEIGLEPVEYPTTRVMDTDPADRARDLHAAFADPSIKAVMASIGGDDQIRVLRHLDPALLRENPKPFFGYSDNTNLLNYLFNLGLVGYHGGSVMVHLGRNGGLHPAHVSSLRAALFTNDWYELTPAESFGDDPGDWSDPGFLTSTPPMWPGEGWTWLGPERVVEAPAWGGNIEIISWLLQAGYVEPVPPSVFFFETSEELPPAIEVYRTLRSMGERGMLAQFPAILVGRAKATTHEHHHPPEVKQRYVADQRAAVERALREYAPDAVVVFDLDIGHTDPQLIVPVGGTVQVDAVARRIRVRY
jgi:muramoyltetrapeptide carboxypeptidase LdcA involved in peptidoglycan recycling